MFITVHVTCYYRGIKTLWFINEIPCWAEIFIICMIFQSLTIQYQLGILHASTLLTHGVSVVLILDKWSLGKNGRFWRFAKNRTNIQKVSNPHFWMFCGFWSTKWIDNLNLIGWNETLESTRSLEKQVWPICDFLWKRSFFQN